MAIQAECRVSFDLSNVHEVDLRSRKSCWVDSLSATLRLTIVAILTCAVCGCGKSAGQGRDVALPQFKYHPDPVASGSVEKSGVVCACCGKARGYIYTSTVIAAGELHGELCPWCIADGSAAEKFDATFSDDYLLIEAGLSEQVIDEVTKRTPGFRSWQRKIWVTHCDDACAFMGNATKEDVQSIAEKNLPVAGLEGVDAETMKKIAAGYEPKGSPAFYKFKCLHCGKTLYGMDFD